MLIYLPRFGQNETAMVWYSSSWFINTRFLVMSWMRFLHLSLPIGTVALCIPDKQPPQMLTPAREEIVVGIWGHLSTERFKSLSDQSQRCSVVGAG